MTTVVLVVNLQVLVRRPTDQYFKATLEISDITFKDFTGTTSSKYDPEVGRLICSSPEVSL